MDPHCLLLTNDDMEDYSEVECGEANKTSCVECTNVEYDVRHPGYP